MVKLKNEIKKGIVFIGIKIILHFSIPRKTF